MPRMPRYARCSNCFAARVDGLLQALVPHSEEMVSQPDIFGLVLLSHYEVQSGHSSGTKTHQYAAVLSTDDCLHVVFQNSVGMHRSVSHDFP